MIGEKMYGYKVERVRRRRKPQENPVRVCGNRHIVVCQTRQLNKEDSVIKWKKLIQSVE